MADLNTIDFAPCEAAPMASLVSTYQINRQVQSALDAVSRIIEADISHPLQTALDAARKMREAEIHRHVQPALDAARRMREAEIERRIQPALDVAHRIIDGQVNRSLQAALDAIRRIEDAKFHQQIIGFAPLATDLRSVKVDPGSPTCRRQAESQSRRQDILDNSSEFESRWMEGWTSSLAVFIPKQIREPIIGDLFEDLRELRESGASTWKMRWVQVSQLLLAVLKSPTIWKIGFIGWFVASVKKWLAN